jgi:hypothetical protein
MAASRDSGADRLTYGNSGGSPKNPEKTGRSCPELSPTALVAGDEHVQPPLTNQCRSGAAHEKVDHFGDPRIRERYRSWRGASSGRHRR